MDELLGERLKCVQSFTVWDSFFSSELAPQTLTWRPSSRKVSTDGEGFTSSRVDAIPFASLGRIKQRADEFAAVAHRFTCETGRWGHFCPAGGRETSKNESDASFVRNDTENFPFELRVGRAVCMNTYCYC